MVKTVVTDVNINSHSYEVKTYKDYTKVYSVVDEDGTIYKEDGNIYILRDGFELSEKSILFNIDTTLKEY